MGAGCLAGNACTDHDTPLSTRDQVATVFGPYPPAQAAASTPPLQEDSFYTWPDRAVGSPFKGEPELSFCRTFQNKYETTCCTTMLDEDIQEEYEERAYLRANALSRPRREQTHLQYHTTRAMHCCAGSGVGLSLE